jgi:hypothetical protein
MPREVEAARLPRLALTLHLREALAVQLEHSQPLRLDRRPLPALAPFIQEEGAAASSY